MIDYEVNRKLLICNITVVWYILNQVLYNNCDIYATWLLCMCSNNGYISVCSLNMVFVASGLSHSDLIVFLSRMIVGYITPEASLIYEGFWQEWLLCCLCIFSFVSIQSSVFNWFQCFFMCLIVDLTGDIKSLWLRFILTAVIIVVKCLLLKLLQRNCDYNRLVAMIYWNYRWVISISCVDCFDITFPIVLIAYWHPG